MSLLPPLLEVVLIVAIGLLAAAAIVLLVGTWGVLERQGRRIGQLDTRVRHLEKALEMVTRSRPRWPIDDRRTPA